MNPATIMVASSRANIKNSRLLAETNAASATSTQVMVNKRPIRVTCWRVP